ncbi:MAG TPA: hypothetical protein VGG38_16770 [Acidimicrobiales bacterium]|jgi:hypothetical protein
MAETVSALAPLLRSDPSPQSIEAAGAALKNLAARTQAICHFTAP